MSEAEQAKQRRELELQEQRKYQRIPVTRKQVEDAFLAERLRRLRELPRCVPGRKPMSYFERSANPQYNVTQSLAP